jgi:hypothetical protein
MDFDGRFVVIRRDFLEQKGLRNEFYLLVIINQSIANMLRYVRRILELKIPRWSPTVPVNLP